MVRKKRKEVDFSVEQPFNEEPVHSLEEEDTPLELEELKAEFSGTEFSVAVFRQSDDKTGWEKIKTYALDNFNADTIAEAYGGGKFKIKVLNGQGKYVKQFTVSYAKPVKDENPAIIPPVDNSKNEVFDFLKTELSSRDMLLAKLLEVNSRPINIPPPNVPNVSEIIQLFTSLQSMTSPAVANQTKVSEIIDVMKLGMNFTKDIAEKSGDTQNNGNGRNLEEIFMNKMVDVLLPKIVNLLSGGFVPQKSAVSRPTAHTPLKTKTPASILEEKKEEIPMITYVSDFEKELFEKLVQEKTKIIGMAKLGLEPEIASQYILSISDENKLFNYLSEYGVKRIVNLLPFYKEIEHFLMLIGEGVLNSFGEDFFEDTDNKEENFEEVEIVDEEKNKVEDLEKKTDVKNLEKNVSTPAMKDGLPL